MLCCSRQDNLNRIHLQCTHLEMKRAMLMTMMITVVAKMIFVILAECQQDMMVCRGKAIRDAKAELHNTEVESRILRDALSK